MAANGGPIDRLLCFSPSPSPPPPPPTYPTARSATEEGWPSVQQIFFKTKILKDIISSMFHFITILRVDSTDRFAKKDRICDGNMLALGMPIYHLQLNWELKEFSLNYD